MIDPVVDRARLGRAAQTAVVDASSASSACANERGDAVEVARVEPERVLVDQRGDLVDVAARVTAHSGSARVAQPRTLPECTR